MSASATPLIQGHGFRHSWGLRRADRQPWRTQPRHTGDHKYYALGEEVSMDGLVLGAGEDLLEAVACMLTQREDAKNVPHPGPAVIVRARYKKSEGSNKYDWWYEDFPHEEILLLISSNIARGARLMAELAPQVETLDIVFDHLPTHEGCNFIEVEDQDGESVELGEWHTRPDGHAVLRMQAVR